MANGRFDFSFVENPCNLRRTEALHTECENLFYRFCRVFIDNPLLLVVGTFQITERRYFNKKVTLIFLTTTYKKEA